MYDSDSDSDDSTDVISYCYSRRNVKDKPDLDPQFPKQTPINCKCNACGGRIEGFRYACVQCANYYQCAECEASGAHAEHYVLRVPRVEHAADLQAVLDQVRHELMLDYNAVQVKIEKDDDEEEQIGESESVVIKVELGEPQEDPLPETECEGVCAVKQESIDTEDSFMNPCGQIAEAVGVFSHACKEEIEEEPSNIQARAREDSNIQTRARELSSVRETSKKASKRRAPESKPVNASAPKEHSGEQPRDWGQAGDSRDLSELSIFLDYDLMMSAPRKRRKSS